MAGHQVFGRPATSCPDFLSFGASYGTQSYCRACYDFTRRYRLGECAGCARIIAVKKEHCRLCWLQADITATGRRITPADFTRAGRYQQLSFAGMTRLGHTSQQLPVPAAGRCRPPAPAAGTQLQLPIPVESLHFDKAHWVASAITGEALQQARHIAELAGTRGWNPRIITETGRALAVVLAGHQTGDLIAWSALPAIGSRLSRAMNRSPIWPLLASEGTESLLTHAPIRTNGTRSWDPGYPGIAVLTMFISGDAAKPSAVCRQRSVNARPDRGARAGTSAPVG